MVEHVGHHIGVGDPERPGPRAQPAGVRAHQADAELCRDVGQPIVVAAPAIVQQVRTSLAGGAPCLVPPGVHADDHVWVTRADRADEPGRAPDLLRGIHLSAGRGRYPAYIDDVGALGDDLFDPRHRGRLIPGQARTKEGIGRPVDDAHDQRLRRRERGMPEAQ